MSTKKLYLVIGISVILFFIIILIVTTRPQIGKYLSSLKDISLQSKSLSEQIQSERDIYKKVAEDVSKEYTRIQSEKERLIKERENYKKDLVRISAELGVTKELQSKPLPKEFNEIIQSFNSLGYPARVMDCN